MHALMGPCVAPSTTATTATTTTTLAIGMRDFMLNFIKAVREYMENLLSERSNNNE